MGGAEDPRAMPLDQFIAEVIGILKTQRAPPEICVENVKPLRFAAESCKFDVIFARLNASYAEGRSPTERFAIRFRLAGKEREGDGDPGSGQFKDESFDRSRYGRVFLSFQFHP